MSYSGFSSNYKNPVVAAAGALGQSSKYFGDQVSAFRNNKLVAGVYGKYPFLLFSNIGSQSQ